MTGRRASRAGRWPIAAIAVFLVLLLVPAVAAAAPGGTLYVQQAEGGTLTRTAGGSWRLVLRRPLARTTSFSDRPYRRGGSLPLSRFVSAWSEDFGSVAPNAALEIANGPADRDVALLELSRPHYDSAGERLIFPVKPLSSISDRALSSLVRRADPGVHGSFGRASLFIDDGEEGALLDLSIQGVPAGEGIEVAPHGAVFGSDPTPTYHLDPQGLFSVGLLEKVMSMECLGGTCSGSATLPVEASPTAGLEVTVIAPATGTVSLSWAGGPTTIVPGPGTTITLKPGG